MKGFLLAQKILTKRWSNLSDKFSRRKSKCVSALSLLQSRLLSIQEETFFYVFPVRKSQNFRELLSPKELERVRLKMQSVVEWQKQFEESSRISKQFSGNVKPKEETNKESQIVSQNTQQVSSVLQSNSVIIITYIREKFNFAFRMKALPQKCSRL